MAEKMKKIICTVTNDLNFDQRMIRICTSLAKAGFDVTLVGRQVPFSPLIKKQPFKQKRFKLFFNKGKLFYLEYNLRLFFYLLFTRFDIINSIDLDTLVPGFFVSKIKNKICVYDAHEYFTEVPEVINRPAVKKIWESVANFIIPKLKHGYTVCESIAEIFEEKYNTPFSVIRNVPFKKEDSGKKKEKRQMDSFILIYQGVLNEGRGLEELIEALPFLDKVELWLFGEGDLSSKIRGLVDKMGLKNKVKFHGRVAPEKLHEFTKQAHLGINLLKNKGLNYYYSLANKTFDYMQAGIPSVCMKFPEYESLNEKYNVFVLVDDLKTETIVNAINSVRKDEKMYDELISHNLKAKKEFIWEQEELKLLEFYNRLN